MATYAEIQAYIKQKYGFAAQTCWIAHMKSVCGIDVRASLNRHSIDSRVKPCPVDKQAAIKDALKHFDMI